MSERRDLRMKAGLRAFCAAVLLGFAAWLSAAPVSPSPLLREGEAVDWWFVFKFNASSFPGCGGSTKRTCAFGGQVQPYKLFSQQYVYADSRSRTLTRGDGCVGETDADPLGATYGQIYSGQVYFVVWNDQFYGDPSIQGCGGRPGNCNSPWGHSKGLVAWNEDGDGVVLQVSTPSWPGAGSALSPRSKENGNTLGCVADNNVMVSQHFFALRLVKDDLIKVLTALANASVATDPSNPQVVRNGGPADVQQLVHQLGKRSKSTTLYVATLSTGARLISKPSALNVPPWQMVSAVLDGRPALRTATWWARPYIPSTEAGISPVCWSKDLGKPGAVEVATSGQWNGTRFGLGGGLGGNFNHGKFGVALNGGHPFAIFGDLNQQGSLDGPNCAASQNGRGGLFFVLEDQKLRDSISQLIGGNTAASGNEP